jgi:bifunctional non-homologous end joining protein LigD
MVGITEGTKFLYGQASELIKWLREKRNTSSSGEAAGSRQPKLMPRWDSIAALDVQDAIIDGEIVALDEKGRSSFQLLQDIAQEKAPIVYYAFDLLRLNGKNLQALPIEERKAQLEQLLKKPPGVIRYSVSFTKDIKELLARPRNLGSKVWLVNAPVPGTKPGNGPAPGSSSSCILSKSSWSAGIPIRKAAGNISARCLSVFTKARTWNSPEVGTGFSDQLLRSLYSDLEKIRIEQCPFFNVPAVGRSRWDQGLTAAEMRRCHWVKPVMVCQVKFTEWTRDDRLRQPVFLGLREDKKASEVMRKKGT